MRKLVTIIILLSLVFCSLKVGATKTDLPFPIQSESAILMEYTTGEILVDKNSHKQLPPASVTKMMVMLLIMEAVDSGKIQLTDKVIASPEACRMGGSQI